MCARRPEVLAVATVEGALTYEELDRRSDALALGLVEAGLEPGDPVVFQMGNELETVVACYGVLKAGLVPVCSIPNHRLARGEPRSWRRPGRGRTSSRPTTATTTSRG